MIRSFRPYPLILLVIALVAAQSAFSQSEATAEYSVTFTGNWTTQSTPGGVVGSAHFTTIAGGKHNSSVSFWSSGATATSGLENLAELGVTSGFISEINASSHTDASFTAGVSGGGTGTSTFTLTVKKTHPLITLASMIGPSPDWFVGLHDYSLLDAQNNWVSSVTVNLYPYDAGTEDGTEFTLSNPATSPQGVITSLRGVGKFSNVQMATISFTRQNAPPIQTAPTISAIDRPSSTSEHTNADSVTWLVTFSEAVQNVSTNDFLVNGSTATVTSVSLVSGTSTQYRLVVSGGNLANLDGAISLGLSTTQDITNNSNVALSTTLPSNAANYMIDNTSPRVSSVSPSSSDQSPFTVSITFNETLQAGSFDDVGDVTSNDADVSTPTDIGLSFQVTVTPNDPAQAGTITLTIPEGAAADLAGNPSSAHEASITYEPEVESTPPVVNSVSAITPDGLYHSDEELEIGVTFSDPVTVTGMPTLELQFDSGFQDAEYDRGSESSTLVFSYTLVTGDSTADLSYVSAQSLDLAGGSIVGSNGLTANLTLPSPGTSGSLNQNSDIRTSGRQDAIPSFGNASVEDQVLMMNQRIDAIPLPSAMGGDAPLRYNLEPMLPPGLQIDDVTHEISGTPTEVFDMTSFTWSVSDVDGDVASLTFTIMILPRLPLQFPTSSSVDDQVFLQNESIETIDLPSARGGDGDLTYSLSPELPTGLTLDIEAGQIAGTPTAVLAPTEYTWQVTDEEGAVVSLTFSITVLEDFQPVFDAGTPAIDVVYIQDSPITPFTLPSAMSGNGELTYELYPELPMGLAHDATSFEISGTPSVQQTRTSFVWRATDEDGDIASFTFYITVLEDLMPSFAVDASVAEREFITDSVIDAFRLPPATGGNGTLSYDLAPNLPEGLELDENTLEISGTPTAALLKTEFTWTVRDEDGDMSSLSFFLTVIQDTQPVFGDQVADKAFVVGTLIDSFTLPEANGGNGNLNYALMPDLPSGLSFNMASRLISGTPTTESPSVTYSWTVTDVDGDTVTLSFAIVVQPAAPEVTGTIPNVRLTVGGGSEIVDARRVVEGTVDSWQVTVADSNVATASVSTTGAITLTPQAEGQTNVSLIATNITDSVQIGFSVNVATDAVENEQIDAALALNAGAILSGAMNVFKKRSNLHHASNGNGGTSALGLTSESGIDESAWNVHHGSGIGNFDPPFAFDLPSTFQNQSDARGNGFVPLNFTHTTTKWSLWGAVDLQNFSNDATNNEIDGSLSSLYLGADLAINENTFAGLAVAQHGGSSSYEFTSDDANGEGEIDTSLMSFYPYLQAGDGHRFSMFLVGGFGSGESEIDRRHANGTEPSVDADLSLFAGGFDYVVLRRASMDLAIIGDAGVATISTEGDSSVLANREISSSKSSIGSSVSFNRQVEGGSLTTSADVRLATGADDDETRTGFELGANLNYLGEHLDFMLDGRMVSRSGDTDAQRSSLSARIRYKTHADGSGLTLSVRPQWQNGSTLAFDDLLNASNHVTGLTSFGVDAVRSIEGEIGYGIWTSNETTLLRPALKWQRLASNESVVKLGSYWHIGQATRSRPLVGFDLFRNSISQSQATYGVSARVDMTF